MTCCVFKTCTNSSGTKHKCDGITFHSFPADELWRDKWLQVVRKDRHEPDWLPNNSSRICSVHFRSEDMYTTHKGYKKVRKDVVPYFRVPMEAHSCSDRTSPNSLIDVDLSDLQSVFDTRKEAYLEKKLNKETIKKRKVMKENKNLKRKCKRLNYRCKRLKEFIVQLEKRMIVT